MSKCRNCVRFVHLNDDGEKTLGRGNWCCYIGDSPDEDLERECCAFRPQTNANRIRAMSDEELAEWLGLKVSACNGNEKCGDDYTCDACWLEWLKREAIT